MGKHEYTTLDRARDELFSHIQRCDVLEAAEDHQQEWLEETMEFMTERYPDLTQLQLAQLEAMGRRYIRPAIPHGSGANELTRTKWKDEETEVPAEDVEIEAADEAEIEAADEVTEKADEEAEIEAA